MNTVQKLLDASKDIWDAYNEHPFVLGIQNGTLSRDKFRFYIIQDYLYLMDYAKSFAVGIAKAKSAKTANLFAKYIAVMNGELNVHSGYMGRLGITEDEVRRSKPSLDNLSYTSYMLRVAYDDGEAEILAAILSCAYSYEVIAKKMLAAAPDCVNDAFYGDWIRDYASQRYSDDNALLLDTLNELTRDYTPAQLEHLAEIFVVCSRYELAFWEMSWNMKM